MVVDDHILFRSGLISLLKEEPNFQIVATASNGIEAVQICQEVLPDVVLMDVHMPRGNGVEAIRALKQLGNIHILMLTISTKDDDLFKALAAGADGYLLKSVELQELYRAIYHAKEGKKTIDPELMDRVIEAAAKQQPLSKLSKREVDVINTIAQGLTTSEMANALTISENTVKTHIQHIFKKLNASNRAEAIARASSLGLLSG